MANIKINVNPNQQAQQQAVQPVQQPTPQAQAAPQQQADLFDFSAPQQSQPAAQPQNFVPNPASQQVANQPTAGQAKGNASNLLLAEEEQGHKMFASEGGNRFLKIAGIVFGILVVGVAALLLVPVG